jgi:anti-anti-sigma regulatory factor
MSCKIERIIDGQDLVVLRVSGRIEGEHVDTLREVIGQQKGGAALDLQEVILADRDAVRLLALSEANGLELRNCPPYIREWVSKERDISYGECI